MPRDENSRGSIHRRSLLRPLDTLMLLREAQWPLLEVRPTSVRIVETLSLSVQRFEVPYVPTSEETVKRMLEIAEVGPGDVVYDLGCGDGRILIMAVEEFGAKGAVGYEIRNEMYKAALSRIEYRGLKGRIRLYNEDLFEANLSEATVITLYLNGSVNDRLKPKLEREARPGTRVVSHDFEIHGWQPIKKENYRGDTIYLYVIPEAFHTPKILRKLNSDLLRLQAILHEDYLDLEKVFTSMDDGTYVIIDGKYVYRRGCRGDKAIISVWTKPMGEPGARCLFNAPIFL